jgi:hypothetical protein
LAIYGYDYKTCQCEDFPCCGHNDVDPNWQPDPYDSYDDFDYHGEPDVACMHCGDEATVELDGEQLCEPCADENRAPECCGRYMQRVDGHLVCRNCDYGSPNNPPERIITCKSS